ncbi:13276_t:CDS:2, partial [Racocetra persica]
PSISSKVDILKNQRKDDVLMKQQREIVQRDISASSSSQSDHSHIMNELDKIIVKHNDDVIRHGGIMARQNSTTLENEQNLKIFRKSSMKKNKNNRNDTVSWHRFGSGPNNRASIRGLLQRVEKVDESPPPGGNESYPYL